MVLYGCPFGKFTLKIDCDKIKLYKKVERYNCKVGNYYLKFMLLLYIYFRFVSDGSNRQELSRPTLNGFKYKSAEKPKI